MIKIENPEYFGIQLEKSGEYTLVNLMIDPEKFDLKMYQKTPFATLCFKTKMDLVSLSKNDLLDFIRIKSIECKIHQYNMYIDTTKYDDIRAKFKSLCHTMIYYIDTTEYERNVNAILIAAIPTSGFVAPMTKSPFYTLYNGKFISCKPFRVEGKCDIKCGLVYVLVDILSSFSMTEFLDTTSETNELLNDNWGTSLEHKWNVKDDTSVARLEDDYPLPISICYYENTVLMPVSGRESLFSKCNRNIFNLSDVPKTVIQKFSSIERKI